MPHKVRHTGAELYVGRNVMSLLLLQEWLMVLTCLLSPKDLADRFASGRSCCAVGNALLCSSPTFHLALAVSW